MSRKSKPLPVVPAEGWHVIESGYWFYVYKDGKHVTRPSLLTPGHRGNVIFKTREEGEEFIRQEVANGT